MLRRILHLDIDAFLASVEQLRDPVLIGKPVAVGAGVVASRSYEAKARGVETAMPLHEALRRCPELIVREGDSRLAERYRQAVATVMQQFSPVVEVCSLDDFYADLTGVPLRVAQALDGTTRSEAEQSLVALCRDLRAEVRRETGLSISQGVGSTRTVARLATTKAKPGGICEVPAGGELEFLADFAVEQVRGIGPKTAAMLHQVGVRTVRELWALDRELLRQSFGARGDELWRRCRGLDDAPVEATPTLRSISRETSFGPRHVAAARLPARDAGLPAGPRGERTAPAAPLCAHRAGAPRPHGRRAAGAFAVAGGGDGSHRRADGAGQRAARRTAVAPCPGAARRRHAGVAGRRTSGAGAGVWRGRGGGGGGGRGGGGGGGAARRRLFAAVDAVRQRHGFGAVVVGASAELLGQLPRGPHGFRLRTPSLSK